MYYQFYNNMVIINFHYAHSWSVLQVHFSVAKVSLIKILFRWRLAGVQYDSGKLCMLAQSYSKTTNEWMTNNIGNNSYKCIIAISELKSWEGISPESLLFPRWLQRILEICWVDFDHIKKITYTEKNWQLKRVEDIQVLCVE